MFIVCTVYTWATEMYIHEWFQYSIGSRNLELYSSGFVRYVVIFS